MSFLAYKIHPRAYLQYKRRKEQVLFDVDYPPPATLTPSQFALLVPFFCLCSVFVSILSVVHVCGTLFVCCVFIFSCGCGFFKIFPSQLQPPIILTNMFSPPYVGLPLLESPAVLYPAILRSSSVLGHLFHIYGPPRPISVVRKACCRPTVPPPLTKDLFLFRSLYLKPTLPSLPPSEPPSKGLHFLQIFLPPKTPLTFPIPTRLGTSGTPPTSLRQIHSFSGLKTPEAPTIAPRN